WVLGTGQQGGRGLVVGSPPLLQELAQLLDVGEPVEMARGTGARQFVEHLFRQVGEIVGEVPGQYLDLLRPHGWRHARREVRDPHRDDGWARAHPNASLAWASSASSAASSWRSFMLAPAGPKTRGNGTVLPPLSGVGRRRHAWLFL